MSAQGAASHREQLANAQMIEQAFLDLDHVPDGNGRKITGEGFSADGVDASRPGGAAATAQEVRANDKQALGVYRFAGADDDVPPARVILGVVRRDMGIAADGMADEHGVVASGAEPAVGFVGNGDAGQHAAEVQIERFVEGKGLHMAQRPGVPDAVTAFKDGCAHDRPNSLSIR